MLHLFLFINGKNVLLKFNFHWEYLGKLISNQPLGTLKQQSNYSLIYLPDLGNIKFMTLANSFQYHWYHLLLFACWVIQHCTSPEGNMNPSNVRIRTYQAKDWMKRGKQFFKWKLLLWTTKVFWQLIQYGCISLIKVKNSIFKNF